MRIARTTRRRRRQPRPGTASAELALLLPVLLLIVLGGIDFGRFAYNYIALANAARAGAGNGSINPYTSLTYSYWQSQVTQVVKDEMSQTSGYDASQVTVTATAVVETGGLWRAEVTATYPFQTLVPWPGIPQTMTMGQKAVIRGTR